MRSKSLIWVVFLLFFSGQLLSDEGPAVLAHPPAANFVPGEDLLLKVKALEKVDSVRLFYRIGGESAVYQVRKMKKENGEFVFKLDTNRFTRGEIYYYFVAKKGEEIMRLPEKGEFMVKASGSMEEISKKSEGGKTSRAHEIGR